MQKFLQDLRVCLSAENPSIYLQPRPGSLHIQHLIDLKIEKFSECLPYLKALKVEEFSHHQQSDFAHEAKAKRHLWIFGVIVGKPGKKQRAAYVKIQLGHTALDAVCISFHRPTDDLAFPFSPTYQTLFDSIYHA